MNILVVSTRQINVGDEFIWFGLRRLLKQVGIDGNFILFNRHPSINPRPRLYTRRPWLKTLQPTFDNSLYLDDDFPIDYVIFAGTPKWNSGVYARMLHPYILRGSIRTSLLGVGTEEGKPLVSPDLDRILRGLTDLIMARDPVCFDVVKEHKNAFQDVCPALFCAGRQRMERPKELKRLGVVIQAHGSANQSIPISDEIQSHLLDQFRRLSERYQVEYVAHYIKDVKMANQRGIKGRVHYSSFSEDFFDIYSRFDAIVSLRVHGCGIAASLGIPSIHIGHDDRAKTTEGFLSRVVSPTADLVKAVQNLDVLGTAQALVEHRRQAMQRWMGRLEEHLVPNVRQLRR